MSKQFYIKQFLLAKVQFKNLELNEHGQKIWQTPTHDIPEHWAAVSTLLQLVSSVYCNLHHWRSNQRPQIAVLKLYNWTLVGGRSYSSAGLDDWYMSVYEKYKHPIMNKERYHTNRLSFLIIWFLSLILLIFFFLKIMSYAHISK